MISSKQILKIAGYAGEIILTNGAEIYRTEDTINRICQAYNIESVHSLVTPTGIFISIDDGSHHSETIVRRIHNRTINLTIISRINNFSRNLQKKPLTYQQAMNKLNRITKQEKKYKFKFATLLTSLGVALNVILMKANYINLIPAFLAAFSSQLVTKKIGFLKKINFIPEMIAGLIAGLVGITCFQQGLGDNLSIIIVTGILPFVPGVSITNAIRDAIRGDLLSSLSRGLEALLIAINLAIGVAISLGGFY